MKNKEDLKFQIDQLRKDKMIYALESIAASVAMIIFLFTASIFFPYANPYISFGIATVIALGYWVFVGVGNTRRLIEIRKLEKRLKEITVYPL